MTDRKVSDRLRLKEFQKRSQELRERSRDLVERSRKFVLLSRPPMAAEETAESAPAGAGKGKGAPKTDR